MPELDEFRLVTVHFPLGGFLNPNSVVACTGCDWRPVFPRNFRSTAEQWTIAHGPSNDEETRP